MCTQLYGLAISLYQSALFCSIFGLVANQVVRDDGSFLRIQWVLNILEFDGITFRWTTGHFLVYG